VWRPIGEACGLKILHTALGTVVSGKTIAGERLTLTGGNLIGGRKPITEGEILIGSNVYLGANAIVLGPVKVGNGAQIGAGAVVISDVRPGAIVVGVPARELRSQTTQDHLPLASPRQQTIDPTGE
jgi:serine acetyltransferase